METSDFLRPRQVNHRPLSPVEFLVRAVEVYPDKTAVVFEGNEMSYRAFGAFVGRIAAGLRSSGVLAGDVVSMMAGNRPETLAMHYAVPMIGAVLNTINTRLDTETVSYILDHAESRLLFCEFTFARTIADIRQDHPQLDIITIGAPPTEAATLEQFIADQTPLAVSLDAITDEWMPICLNYTSGTTGRPKGVVYHHRGAYLNAIGNAITLGFDDRTEYMWILPMFHCNGWCHPWAVTAVGGTHICMPGVDAGAMFEMISSRPITHFCCAPVVLYMLLNAPVELRRPAAVPIIVGTGGASPTTALIEGMDALGIELVHLYGLTETYGPVSATAMRADWGSPDSAHKAELLSRQGVRHPLFGSMRVVDGDGNDVAKDGEMLGEIALASSTLMAGYYKDGEATEKAFADDLFRTGDLAVMHPDGYVEVKDRTKDLIISGGENISSLEIESVLHRHPSVLLAAVIAFPDPKWGEVPCACIELKPGTERPALQDITDFCRQHLAGFQVPKKFLFLELPKTATGKIQKFMLRQQAERELG